MQGAWYQVELRCSGGGKGGLSEDRLRYKKLACGTVPNFQLNESDEDLGLAGGSVLTGVDCRLLVD